jgi:DNA-binding response OmpR family regulator
MKLLIIEDSERLRRSLGQGLLRSGHTADLVGDGEDALTYCRSYPYDAIVLDLLLPGLSGFEVLTRLKTEKYPTPILILSAKDQLADRVRGLDSGADDYLVKPFAFEELLARLRALVRRYHDQHQTPLRLGDLEIDLARREVRKGSRLLPLTPSELALLETLALRRGRAVSRRLLIDLLYESKRDVAENSLEVLVCGLRRKIDPGPGGESLIKTRRGYGYQVE